MIGFDINDRIIETFACLDYELDLEDEESENDYDNILRKIKDITVNEFLIYEKHNFKFDKNIKVNWKLYES